MSDPQPVTLAPEQLRSLQLKSLEAYAYLEEFCVEHNITVWFDAGGLLGAIRDKGFIPWDDDVDVLMPRPDFERFSALWPLHADTQRFTYVGASPDLLTRIPMVKIYDNHTTCLTENQWDLDTPQGLAIDILLLDGCPNSKLARATQVMWAMIYNLFIAQFAPTNYGKFIELGCRILLGVVRSPSARHRVWRHAESRMTKVPYGSTPWVRYLCGGPTTIPKVFELAWFADTVMVDFEDRQVPAPIGYHEYLTKHYGDYMTPPPEDQRKPHHGFLFVDLDTPYETHRGTLFGKGAPGIPSAEV